MASLGSWLSDHKLATAGTLGASALVCTRRKYPLKGLRAVTVAVVAGWAVKRYYFDVKRAMEEGGEYPPEWSEISRGGGGGEDSEERWSW